MSVGAAERGGHDAPRIDALDGILDLNDLIVAERRIEPGTVDVDLVLDVEQQVAIARQSRGCAPYAFQVGLEGDVVRSGFDRDVWLTRNRVSGEREIHEHSSLACSIEVPEQVAKRPLVDLAICADQRVSGIG